MLTPLGIGPHRLLNLLAMATDWISATFLKLNWRGSRRPLEFHGLCFVFCARLDGSGRIPSPPPILGIGWIRRPGCHSGRQLGPIPFAASQGTGSSTRAFEQLPSGALIRCGSQVHRLGRILKQGWRTKFPCESLRELPEVGEAGGQHITFARVPTNHQACA